MEMIKKLQIVWYEEYETGESDALAVLYHNVLDEYQDDVTARNYQHLWAEIAPSGNIYRYCALMSERLRHCWDLQQQVREFCTVNNVPGETQDQRMLNLVKSLKQTRVTKGEEIVEKEGYKPLEEFLGDPVKKVMGFVVPCDDAARKLFWKNIFMANLVLAIQVIGPFVMCLEQAADADQLGEIFSPSSWSMYQIVCLGNNHKEVLTTIMGTLFLVLVMSISHSYSEDEVENAEKSERLPFCRIWNRLGMFANGWCVIFTLLDSLLMFWNEDSATDIIKDSLALLFIFTLDDLTGGCCDYLGQDDSDFQRACVYNYALLSQCPLRIADVLSVAPSEEATWSIATSAGGRLLKSNARSEDTGAEDASFAPTRIMVAPGQADASLADRGGGEDSRAPMRPSVFAQTTMEDLSEMTVQYRRLDAHDSTLPTSKNSLSVVLWHATAKLCQVSQYLIPLVFLFQNNPCEE